MAQHTFLEVIVDDSDAGTDVLYVSAGDNVLFLDHHQLVLALVFQKLVVSPPTATVQRHAGRAAVSQYSHRVPLAVTHLDVWQPQLVLVG